MERGEESARSPPDWGLHLVERVSNELEPDPSGSRKYREVQPLSWLGISASSSFVFTCSQRCGATEMTIWCSPAPLPRRAEAEAGGSRRRRGVAIADVCTPRAKFAALVGVSKVGTAEALPLGLDAFQVDAFSATRSSLEVPEEARLAVQWAERNRAA